MWALLFFAKVSPAAFPEVKLRGPPDEAGAISLDQPSQALTSVSNTLETALFDHCDNQCHKDDRDELLLDYGAIPLVRDTLRQSLHQINDAYLAYHNSEIYECA